MEQGEISESPEYHGSPEIELHPQHSDEYDESNSGREDEEEESHSLDEREPEDSLDIKPPQAHAGRKDKHRHKHREEKHRDRGNREVRDRHRDRERNMERVKSKEREKDRPKEAHAEREARDSGKEREKRLPKDKDRKESEARRREKSQRERERLEQLERQRHRLERERARKEQEERQRREQEHRERLMRAEREKERERAERIRRKEEDSRRRAAGRYEKRREKEKHREKKGSREHSRDHSREHSREESRSPVRHERDASGQREERPHRHTPSPPPKEDLRSVISRPDHDDDQDLDETMEEAYHRHHRHQRTAHSDRSMEEMSDHEDHSEAERSSSPSSSEQSPGDSGKWWGRPPVQSESGSESEREELQQSHSPEERQTNGKFKSKFDDQEHSDSPISPEPQEPPEEDFLDDTPPESPIELKPDLPPYYPAIQGCRNVEEFQCLNRIEEGTYGVVFRARDKKTDETVALKKLKMEKEKEGFPITSLREINTLLKAQHPNVVTVREIVVGSNMDKIYIVMDYVEHDLKSLMETMKEPFMIGEVKTLLIQLLRGVAHLHDNWIIHRDLKTSNLLLSHKGILKIGDFGLAREYGSPLKQYTPIVVTLWYRAPELLLGTKEYSTYIDMWSVGCIFAEFLTRKPLFPGKSEIDQLNRIFKELGTPTERIWPGVGELPAMKKCTFADHPFNHLRNRFGSLLSDKGFDLMNKFLTYNPSRRISAEDSQKHDYFREAPLPIDPSMFPTWPAKSEQPRRHNNTPKPPSGGKAFSKLLGDDDTIQGGSGGFHLSTATKGVAATGAGFSLKFGP